jgi:hypothetical protein
VNAQLDAAVLTLAGRLFPLGFTPRDTAPSTLADLKAAWDSGPAVVWAGASDDTIFGSPEVNWAFRAWHDWAHYRYALPFTRDGEREAAFVQVAHLVRLYGDGRDVAAMAALVLCEVIGQAEAFGTHGKFPDHQRAFTEANVWRFAPLAKALVAEFGRVEASDRYAIAKARKVAKAVAPLAA